ncbi:MAG TPA: response regulator, partial [Terriglobales bacterium]|nr:response regulator [Terriglobales bacterium]
LMKAFLQRKGYEVLTAASGREAIELFQDPSIELAVIDYYMPEENGDVVARRIKALRPSLPVLIFSGSLSLPDRVMARVDGFVSTSEDPELLLEKIGELLPIRRAQAS